MEQFLRWAAELGVSDSTDPSRSRDSCLGRTLSVADFPLAGGCVRNKIRSFIIFKSLNFFLFSLLSFPRIDRTRRGLGAVRELRKGELVLKVPRNALLTTESMVAKDQNLRDSINLHASLSSTQVLFSLSSDALLRKSHNLRIFFKFADTECLLVV